LSISFIFILGIGYTRDPEKFFYHTQPHPQQLTFLATKKNPRINVPRPINFFLSPFALLWLALLSPRHFCFVILLRFVSSKRKTGREKDLIHTRFFLFRFFTECVLVLGFLFSIFVLRATGPSTTFEGSFHWKV
jgi:hypothetical protein